MLHAAAPEFAWREDADDGAGGLIPGDRRAPVNARLRALLPDGVHLSGEGYRVLYGEVKRVIAATWPWEDSEAVEPVWPVWELPVVEDGHVGTYYPEV